MVWLPSRLADRLADRLTVRMADKLICALADSHTYRVSDRLADRHDDRLADRLLTVTEAMPRRAAMTRACILGLYWGEDALPGLLYSRLPNLYS